jgi:hypothetical protein
MKLYGKRWGIGCGFRDTKDLRFGMGMASIHVSTPARRDRLWLLKCLCHHAIDIARGCRRSTRIRSIPQVKHHQAAHSLAVPAGLHALRPDPQHARTAAVAADRAVRCDARGTPRGCRYFRGAVKMSGVVRARRPPDRAKEDNVSASQKPQGIRGIGRVTSALSRNRNIWQFGGLHDTYDLRHLMGRPDRDAG